MRLIIDAKPGEKAARAGDLIKALALDLSPASPIAGAVLDLIEDQAIEAKAARPLRDPSLERLRQGALRAFQEEMADLEQQILSSTTDTQQEVDEEGADILRGYDDQGNLLWEEGGDEIEKAAHHKYIRRVPTGNPKRPWRYYYRVSGGKGLGHESEMLLGAKFRLQGDDGADGHYHITRVTDDELTIVHDETGDVRKVTRQELKTMLHREHKAGVEAHREGIKRNLIAVRKFGSATQQARIEEEAKKYGVIVEGEKRKSFTDRSAGESEVDRAQHFEAVQDEAAKIWADAVVILENGEYPAPEVIEAKLTAALDSLGDDADPWINLSLREMWMKAGIGPTPEIIQVTEDDASYANEAARDTAKRWAKMQTTLADGAPGILIEVPVTHIESLKRKFARLQKKAAKLALVDAPRMEVGDKVLTKSVKNYTIGGKQVESDVNYREVKVAGGHVQIPGYTFIASLDHTPVGNIVRAAPGVENVPEHYKHASSYCEHCNSKRKRTSTFVLQDKDGTLHKVGRTCLKDFTGHDSAAGLGQSSQWAGELQQFLLDADLGGGGGGGLGEPLQIDATGYIATVLWAANKEGWNGDKYTGTTDLAWNTAREREVAKRRGDSTLSKKLTPPQKYLDEALDVISHIRKQSGRNTYFWNVHAAMEHPEGIQSRTSHLVGSAVGAYLRDTSSQSTQKREGPLAPPDQRKHVGTLKKRETFRVKLIAKPFPIEGYYGVSWLHRFADESGNSLVWFGPRAITDDHPDLPENDFFYLKGTVKGHKRDRRDNAPETQLSRAVPSDPPKSNKKSDPR